MLILMTLSLNRLYECLKIAFEERCIHFATPILPLFEAWSISWETEVHDIRVDFSQFIPDMLINGVNTDTRNKDTLNSSNLLSPMFVLQVNELRANFYLFRRINYRNRRRY